MSPGLRVLPRQGCPQEGGPGAGCPQSGSPRQAGKGPLGGGGGLPWKGRSPGKGCPQGEGCSPKMGGIVSPRQVTSPNWEVSTRKRCPQEGMSPGWDILKVRDVPKLEGGMSPRKGSPQAKEVPKIQNVPKVRHVPRMGCPQGEGHPHREERMSPRRGNVPQGGVGAVTYGRGVALGALAGEAAEDAALRHLEAGGDGGDAGEGGGEAGDVRLHVAQQLLQLVQHWHRGERERERKRGGGGPSAPGGRPAPTHNLLIGYS